MIRYYRIDNEFTIITQIKRRFNMNISLIYKYDLFIVLFAMAVLLKAYHGVNW